MHRTDNRQRVRMCVCANGATVKDKEYVHDDNNNNNNKHIYLYKFEFMYYQIKEVRAFFSHLFIACTKTNQLCFILDKQHVFFSCYMKILTRQ